MKKTTFMQCCIDHTGTTLHRNIVYSCCPNTYETTLDKKYLPNVESESTDIFLQENNLYNGHVHKYQIHFLSFVQTDLLLS